MILYLSMNCSMIAILSFILHFLFYLTLASEHIKHKRPIDEQTPGVSISWINDRDTDLSGYTTTVDDDLASRLSSGDDEQNLKGMSENTQENTISKHAVTDIDGLPSLPSHIDANRQNEYHTPKEQHRNGVGDISDDGILFTKQGKPPPPHSPQSVAGNENSNEQPLMIQKLSKAKQSAAHEMYVESLTGTHTQSNKSNLPSNLKLLSLPQILKMCVKYNYMKLDFFQIEQLESIIIEQNLQLFALECLQLAIQTENKELILHGFKHVLSDTYIMSYIINACENRFHILAEYLITQYINIIYRTNRAILNQKKFF